MGTPLLRINDIDNRHHVAIKAAVNVLAWETTRQLTEQYPKIKTADIFAIFGITSKPVERTQDYYVNKDLRRMVWAGGSTSPAWAPSRSTTTTSSFSRRHTLFVAYSPAMTLGHLQKGARVRCWRYWDLLYLGLRPFE